MCKKFDDSSFSYYWGMFRALKFKVDHMKWPRPFKGQFIVRRLVPAMIHRHTELEVSTITCNWDIKGNAKICKNSHFEPPFGGLRGNAQGSSKARWKAHCRHTISDDWTFFASSHGWGTIKQNVEIGIFGRGRSLWAQILGRWGRRPQSYCKPLDVE